MAGLRDGAAACVLERAEVAAEHRLLLVGEALAVEHEHGLAIHAGRRVAMKALRRRSPPPEASVSVT